jgi:HSP20 family protein
MVKITRFQPHPQLSAFGERMESLFDEMMGRRFRSALDDDSVRGAWAPRVDIMERKDGLEIRADLPGMKPEDVDVTVEDGMLAISGERRLEETQEGETFHRVECTYGRFERSFTLPTNVDTDKISAQFANGELILSLPKREEAKPKSVKIQVAKK